MKLRFLLLLALVLAVAFLLGSAIRAGWESVPRAVAGTPYEWSPVPMPAAASPLTPQPSAVTPRPAPSMRATPPPPKPKPAYRPAPAHRLLTGWATWYNDHPGIYAAAGPLLRRAFPNGWRGETVQVCAWGKERCVVVRLGDFCACGWRHGRPTLVDLSLGAFRRLGSPSRGVLLVEVRR